MDVRLWLIITAIDVTAVSTNGGAWTACYSEQLVEFGKKGFIYCKFAPNFNAVYWYDNATDLSAKPIMTYANFQKGGSGYARGEYDIFDNGTLIIPKVSIYHERIFKVICFTTDDVFTIFRISVTVSVLSRQVNPFVEGCYSTSGLCLVQKRAKGTLVCFYGGSRPASRVTWFHEVNKRQNPLNSSTTVWKTSNLTYDTASNVSLADIKSNISFLSLTCKSKEQTLPDWKVKRVLVEQLPEISFESETFEPVYFMINGVAQLKCPSRKAQTIVWKMCKMNSCEIIAFRQSNITRIMPGYREKFDIGNDGSLHISQLQLSDEGNFVCISSNGAAERIKGSNLVVIILPPSSHLIVEECDSQPHCFITSDKEGILTCVAPGVRPQVTLKWLTDREDKITFQTEETKAKEVSDVFVVERRLHYLLTDEVNCMNDVTILCKASGPAINFFQSSVSVKIKYMNCNTGKGVISDQRFVTTVISTVALVILTGAIGAILLVLKRRRRCLFHNESRENTEMQNLIHTVEDFRKELLVSYKELLGNISKIQLSKDGFIDDSMYISNITFINEPEKVTNTCIGQRRVKTLQEFFTLDNLAEKNIVLEGKAGFGKTFFAMKVVSDWIKSCKEQKSQLYEMLIVLSLKDVNKSSLFEAIVEQLLPKDTDFKVENVEELLKKEKRILFLLDDFHQYLDRHNKNSEVHMLMKKKKLRNCKVILLTRPCKKAKLEGSFEKLFLESFSFDQVRKFLTVLSDDTGDDSETSLVKLSEKHDSLLMMWNAPLYLFLIATYFRKDQSIIRSCKTPTDIFKCLVQNIFYQKTEHSPKAAQELKDTNDQNIKMKLYQAAFNDLITSNNCQTEKTIRDVLDDYIVEYLTDLGILKEIDIYPYEKREVTFSHVIYQQFFAANYLVMQSSEVFDELLKRIDVKDCQHMLQFTCGLLRNDEKLKKVIDAIFEGRSDELNTLEDSILPCLYEAGKADRVTNVEELVKDFVEKYSVIKIRGQDDVQLKSAKAFFIDFCLEKEIFINTLSFTNAVNSVTENGIHLDNGLSCQVPHKVESYFFMDFAGKLNEEDLQCFTATNNDLKHIVVQSGKEPKECSEFLFGKIKANNVKVVWITYEGDNVKAVNFPSMSYGEWMNLSETIVINFLKKSKKMDDHKLKLQVSNMKNKGLKKYLESNTHVSIFERNKLSGITEDILRQLEECINDWRLLSQTNTMGEAGELLQNFCKSVSKLEKKIKMYTHGKGTDNEAKTETTEIESSLTHEVLRRAMRTQIEKLGKMFEDVQA